MAVIATSALLVHCGSRSELEVNQETHGSADGGAAAPEAAPPDVALIDGSSCTPAPAGGIAIGTFATEVISMGIAVAGGTVYAGTSALAQSTPLYVGAISRVAASGGPTQPLAAPSFNFGNLATDGTRLYYLQSSGTPDGPNGAAYEITGLASMEVASGAVHSITTLDPPRSTSSVLDSWMFAASSAFPGVFWIGAPSGSIRATTLSAWNAPSDAIATIATGEDLRGVAVDSTRVYWADVGGGQGITLYSSPFTGGQPFTVATVPGGTHGQLLGVSSTDIVFVPDYATGVIDAVSKSGGPVRQLATASSAWVNDSAWVDDLYLYWNEDSAQTTLKRVAVAGGSVEVVPTQGDIQSVAFDACNAYVATTSPTRIFVQPK